MLGKVTLGSVKSITLKEIMKMSDAEMNVVCDALFNDDYNDEWFEQAGRESNRETLLTLDLSTNLAKRVLKSYSLGHE